MGSAGRSPSDEAEHARFEPLASSPMASDAAPSISVAESVADLAARVLTPTAGAVHADGGLTEQLAAKVSKVSSSKLRLLVLAALGDAGVNGHTDPELERLLGKPRPTPGNRRGDLVKFGLAVKAYRTRPHPTTGNPCQVWQLTLSGFVVLAHLGGPSAARALARKFA